MGHIKFDYSNTDQFIAEHELTQMQPLVTAADTILREGTGAGSDYIGWVDLPKAYDKEEYARIKKAAAKIQSDSDVLVVLGIGGSYLGAKSAIDFLSHSFQTYNLKKNVKHHKSSLQVTA